MIKLLAIYPLIALLFIAGGSKAQQRPQYTQYFLNNYLLNPAFAGIENYIDVKAGHRSQWKGIEGAPVTSYVTATLPIGEGFLNGGPGSGNPSGRLYTQNYVAAAPHHGTGLSIISDKSGLLSSTTISGSYAYHLGLSTSANMAVGVTAGVNRYALNSSLLTAADAGDPLINAGGNGRWNPDVSIGALLYGADYYVGFSVQQLLPQQMFNGDILKNTKTVPHYFFTTGLKLFLTEDVTLMPSVLLKMTQPMPLAFDVNMKVNFRDIFWLGSSYRKNDAVSAFAGVNISSLISVGYSYDVTTSYLNAVSNGTHEIVLGIMLNNKYQVKCPQRSF